MKIMNTATILCLCLSLLTSVLCCSASLSQQQPHKTIQVTAKAEPPESEWQAAVYQGLTIGKSTRAGMLRVFGKPQWSGPPGDQTPDDPNPEVWNEYNSSGEFPGKLTVVVDKRSSIISRIDVYPENLSKEEALRHFGDDYVITRYDFDDCLGDGESAPLYESPTGQFVTIEYRKRGIALALEGQTKILYISYVRGPFGAKSAKC